MELAEQLARQGLLLQFISECAGLGSLAALRAALVNHLGWIADYDTCSVCLPADTGLDTEHWCMQASGSLVSLHEAQLPPAHQRGLADAAREAVPVLVPASEGHSYGLALPPPNDAGMPAALCLCRSARPFSQGDVRQLQHACRALGGALTRIIGARTERLAQQEAEEADARMRALAEDRALLAEQMIGIVSHDLRNPLTVISTGTVLLTRGENSLSSQQLRVLNRVASAAERARRMVDDLLDFTLTRVGHGLQVNRADVDLHGVVARVVDELAMAFEGHTLQHKAEGEGDVSADADRIAQMLGNLIANAVTYGDPGQPIVVSSHIADGLARVSVQNQGPTIAPALQRSMFEPMVRGAPDSGGRSVGLGLYIVRAIAQAHGGNVQVLSDPDAGTSFEIEFPAYED